MPYAADVVIIARIDGAPKAAQFFSTEEGVEVSEKQVKILLRKVREGEIIVTREELIAAAKSHPKAAQYLLRNPSLVDPRGKRTASLPASSETIATKESASIDEKPLKNNQGDSTKVSAKHIITPPRAAGSQATAEKNEMLDEVDAALVAAGIPVPPD